GQRMAAAHELRALFAADTDVLHHGPPLRVADRGSHFRSGVETVPDAERLGTCDERIEELVVDPLVDHHAARGGAPLSGGAESTPYTSFNRELQIGVVHHDDDVFAAHFEVDFLERRRCLLRDRTADVGRTGKRNDADLFADDERFSDVAAAAGDEVDDAVREACFLENFHEVQRGELREA